MLATTAAAYIDKSLVLYSGGISDLPSDDEDIQNLIPEEEEDEIVLADEAEDMQEDELVHIFDVDDEEDQPAQTTTPISFSSQSIEDIISSVMIALKPILEAGFTSISQTMVDVDQMVT